jgi:hypothetical protein
VIRTFLRRALLERIALPALVLLALTLDFSHGVALGQDNTLYQPIYRVRQTLAVALSQMHSPPLGGYLAYGSIVRVFEENGWTIFNDEPGPHSSPQAWTALLTDGLGIDKVLEQASHVEIDPALPPDFIAANEVGWADYIHLSFALFGMKIASLYYLYYLIILISCILFIFEFRHVPLLLFALAVYMGGHIYLHEVAADSIRLYSITNSRLYAGLSFPAAAHLLFAFWLGRPLRPLRFAAVLIQSAILALAITCREEVLWQAIMVLGGATIVIAHNLMRRRRVQTRELLATKRNPLWVPATMVCTIAFAYGHIAVTASPLYEAQMKSHIFWHEVLMGLLIENSPLQAIYNDQSGLYGDRLSYDAVTHDLNQRQDASSPIALVQGGKIIVDQRKSWRDYDALCRSLVIRIIRQHPFLAFQSIFIKIKAQMTREFVWYPATVGGANLPAAIIGLAVIVWIAIGGGAVPRGHYVVEGMIIAALIVGCSLITTVLTHPAAQEMASLLTWLPIIAVALVSGAATMVRRVLRPAGSDRSSAPQ